MAGFAHSPRAKLPQEIVPTLGPTYPRCPLGPYHTTPWYLVPCPVSIRKLMKLNVTERHRSFALYTLLIALTFFWIAPKPSGLRFDLLIYTKKAMTKNRKPFLCFNFCNSSSIPDIENQKLLEKKWTRFLHFTVHFPRKHKRRNQQFPSKHFLIIKHVSKVCFILICMCMTVLTACRYVCL